MLPLATTRTANASRRDVFQAPPPQARSRQICELLQHVHAHLFDPSLSVKTLKARCRVRDNNVSCRFKLETGQYLHAYITMRRLQAAAELLGGSPFSIAEIAARVGYRHLQTFYRVFKDHFGCTPAVFRGASLGRPGDVSACRD
jgi:AraC-like DNA-binding protein